MRHRRKTSAVVVATTAGMNRQKELATYTCTDCGHNTVVQASIDSPFCVHCGGDHLEPQERVCKRTYLLTSDDSELTSINVRVVVAFNPYYGNSERTRRG